MRTLIVLIPARREGSETATKSGDNTRATTDNQHFTCRSQSPAPDSSAPRPAGTGNSATPSNRIPHPELRTNPHRPLNNHHPKERSTTPRVPLPFCKSAAHLRPPSSLTLQIRRPSPLLGFSAQTAGARRLRCGVLYFLYMDQATKEAFAKLTQTVERGFAAVAEDIADGAAGDDLRSNSSGTSPACVRKCMTASLRYAKNSATSASVSKRSKRPRVIRLG